MASQMPGSHSHPEGASGGSRFRRLPRAGLDCVWLGCAGLDAVIDASPDGVGESGTPPGIKTSAVVIEGVSAICC